MTNHGPLAGIRIIDCSILGPAALSSHLVDLGAEVIKVEPPDGDYVRQMTWPIIDGISLMHLHLNRGKKSIALDLSTEDGAAVFKDLARGADAVIEGMRPGGLERRGLGYEDLRAINQRIVFCTISGYGATGPYRDLPSHGIAFDAWAGIVRPETDENGFDAIPEHTSIGMNVGPLYGAFGVVSAILQARITGVGSQLEIAQTDAAAAMDWLRIETIEAYERPESEVTGNPTDGHERRAPGTAGMRDGVRYQFYGTSDGRHILFMASEQQFWRNFCIGLGRLDLYEDWPGQRYGDHARGNRALQNALRDIFATRTADQWVQFGRDYDAPISPVNTPDTLRSDPQFLDRCQWLRTADVGADMMSTPLKFVSAPLPTPVQAPTPGQHTDEVLGSVLGYESAKIAALRTAGVVR